MKKKLSHYLFFIVFIVFLFPHNVFAAHFSIESQATSVSRNDRFDIKIFLSTDHEILNALEGTVTLPQGFSLEKISNGNSLVSVWLESPHQVKNQVIFSGIIPGGIQSDTVPLFTITLTAREKGNATLTASGKAYVNDGIGTVRVIPQKTIPLSISGTLGGKVLSVDTTNDIALPEAFMPLIAKDANLFDGAYFISFETQDKSSGISEYKIAEAKGFFTPHPNTDAYVTARSPFLLKDQNLSSYIFVKAIDGNGNERIAIVSPQKGIAVYKLPVLFAILLVCIALFFLRRRRSRRKK